ncbi:IscS subfamily cysteine desulfurase [Marinibactrum halimedae]|uniref:cysteine desulfurase n=1 Tax=Marinibactrum halimedae TaxID=1444977 RepID=A0AA37WMC7_9GAMM|nr:IscS subfamily cysteine desulfurase [Marinibactrum halimedae]GLS26135.1 cysteine desulfurase IscS [Marinibactrum halimedae]
MKKQPIYLDYAATTPVDPSVVEAMSQCLMLDGNFANPASRSHRYGWQAEEAVENARRQVADLIGADPREVVWTSGATESDNLAIKGAALANKERGQHLITSMIEHKAVLDCFAWLEQEGFVVTYLQPSAEGMIHPDQVRDALREDTILVSLMHVNNELGTVTDVAEVGALCRERGVLFHVDAAQSAGKFPIDVMAMNIDLLSVCAHKIYGPKGVGALYVRRRPPLSIAAQIHGGGHERGYRSGTLATHQCVGMGAAFELAGQQRKGDAERISRLSMLLADGLQTLGGVVFHGDQTSKWPGILNVGFQCVDGEHLLFALKDIAVSSGSACTSASVEPSYVLTAIGVPPSLAHSSLRFSIGRFTTQDDISQTLDIVGNVLEQLSRLSS